MLSYFKYNDKMKQNFWGRNGACRKLHKILFFLFVINVIMTLHMPF